MPEPGSEQGEEGQARLPTATAPVLQFAILSCAVTMVIVLAVAVAATG